MKIVAITACPSGIAHTYMAAMKLETTAKELGHDIKVEKQGAKGIEDELTNEDIQQADIVIFAVNTKVINEERFQDKAIYRCQVNEPIRNAQSVIENAIAHKKEETSFFTQVMNPVQTGFSHMVPLVVGATALIAIGKFVSNFYLDTLTSLGNIVMTIALTIFTGYVAYDIADKPGLVTGLAGGIVMNQVRAGLFEHVFIGFLAGYVTKYLLQWIKMKDDYAGVANNLVTIFAMMLTVIIGYAFARFFEPIHAFFIIFFYHIEPLQAMLVASLIAIMMAYDLGGPVNKMAMFIAVGLISYQIYLCNTAAMLSICIPPLGYGVYSLLFSRTLSPNLKEDGKKALKLGLIGMSEGALPFTLKDKKRFVPINILGCVVGSAFVVYFGVNNPTLIAGIYGWFLIPQPWIYVIGLLLGVMTIVIGTWICRKSLQGE